MKSAFQPNREYTIVLELADHDRASMTGRVGQAQDDHLEFQWERQRGQTINILVNYAQIIYAIPRRR